MQLFTIPNILTACNLLSGVLSILLALAGRLDYATLMLLVAAIFDFLDGMAARMLSKTSPLGKQLDSLADMVSFGVAPGILMMVVLVVSIHIEGPIYHDSFSSHVHFELTNWFNALLYGVPNDMDASIRFLPLIALFIPFMAMFRLAKFNIDERQTDQFIGVPTPLATMFFCFFPMALWFNFEQISAGNRMFALLFNSYYVAGVLVIVSILMVTEMPLFSLKFKHMKWSGNEVRYVFLILSIILLIIFLEWAIPLIFLLQICLSIIWNQRKKSTHEIQS
jgi:CDP-diacylglycerol--serine O-phosphatidyltransferase